MVHIYYHVYAIDGVDSIIDEQLNLIKTHFDFPYILNVGISIANTNQSTTHILQKFKNIKDVRVMGNEFTTLELIENDKETFGDSDYILYIHTKGASKQDSENVISWRQLMNYFNIEKVKNVFKLFEKTEFNTYGVLLNTTGDWKMYYGNFWWMKASYAKTINLDNVRRSNRFLAESCFIQMGKNWKPYSSYNVQQNPYLIQFKREEYTL
jgi:hypothetical protein